jgi:uncharacterized protein YbcI
MSLVDVKLVVDEMDINIMLSKVFRDEVKRLMQPEIEKWVKKLKKEKVGDSSFISNMFRDHFVEYLQLDNLSPTLTRDIRALLDDKLKEAIKTMKDEELKTMMLDRLMDKLLR